MPSPFFHPVPVFEHLFSPSVCLPTLPPGFTPAFRLFGKHSQMLFFFQSVTFPPPLFPGFPLGLFKRLSFLSLRSVSLVGGSRPPIRVFLFSALFFPRRFLIPCVPFFRPHPVFWGRFSDALVPYACPPGGLNFSDCAFSSITSLFIFFRRVGFSMFFPAFDPQFNLGRLCNVPFPDRIFYDTECLLFWPVLIFSRVPLCWDFPFP